ncbi:AMP-binding protein [Sphingomonas sp.]|uniref:AMP-binding protein n=1 Tax=Sphingomonas sp. TaxID=28214 RepID=UPI003D6CDF95
MHFTDALHRAVQRHPDKIAVRCAGGERSYRDFADRVARLAAALQRLGMQPGDRVAMLSLNSERYLEYQFAVPRGGGVLNPCNIRWSAAEIAYSLRDSGTTILLIDERFSGLVAELRLEAPSLREVIYCGDAEAPAGMHAYETLVAAAAPVPDMIKHTTGASTSAPNSGEGARCVRST